MQKTRPYQAKKIEEKIISKWEKDKTYSLKTNNKDPKYYTNAIMGEFGEFCNALKHYQGGGTNPVSIVPKDLWLELMDVQIYLILLMECMGMHESVSKGVFLIKMNELEDRMNNKRRV